MLVAQLAAGFHGKLAGFVAFIREKGVIGLAIGLDIGTAASGLVTQLNVFKAEAEHIFEIEANGLKSLNTTVEFAGG